MRNWTPFIAVIALVVYLAAAFVDCEPDAPLEQRIAVALLDSDSPSHGGGAAASAHAEGQNSAGGAHDHHDHPADHAVAHAGGTARRKTAAPHAHAAAKAHAAQDHEAAPKSHHGHGEASHSALAASAASPPSPRSPTRAASADSPSGVQRAERHLETRLFWEATCLCGCEESRGTVGGTLSRLGPVVAGMHVASLWPFEAPNALPWVILSPQLLSFEIDPIPI